MQAVSVQMCAECSGNDMQDKENNKNLNAENFGEEIKETEDIAAENTSNLNDDNTDNENNETSDGEESSNEDNEKIIEELEMVKKQLAELNDKYLRLAAEYDNYRKRTQKEKVATYDEAYSDALLLILPVVDNVERAAEFATDDTELSKGIKLLKSQCEEMMTKAGVEEIKSLGEQFDPSLHNAIAHAEDEETPANTITEVFLKGYKRGDKVIRHALVKVTN